MKTRNEKYWADRANRRMDGYILSAEEQAKVINRAYNRTRVYVQSEIEKILHHVGDEDSLAYEYRMKRLAALLKNTEQKMKELYGINVEDTTEFLRSIIPEAYYHTIFDIAQGTGEEPMFSAVNTKLIDSIVKEPWSGQNYSKRIWNNTNKLADEVREVLTEAAQSGESISKTSKKLADAFNTSQYNAERLIRTETTYACNQAEIAGYKELDIDKYRFVATLDTRTSPICQKLDGKVFPTDKAQAGKNLPSMHPNCRSTTIPEFEEGMPEFRTARDKDGNRITVPADMTYPEWYDKYVKPQEGQNAPKTPSKSPKGNNTIPRPEPRKTPVRTPERAPVEIDIPAPNVGEPEYRDTAIPKRPTEVPRPEPKKAEGAYTEEPVPQAENVNNPSIDNIAESGIIEEAEETREFDPLPPEKVVPVLRKDSKKWIGKLSSEERRAIQKYTKNIGDPDDDKFFARLNAMLRGDIPEDDTLNYYSGIITGAISKYRLKYDIICYRGIDVNIVEGKSVGDIYTSEQFFSTSVKKRGALNKKFFYTILAHKGSKGAYIELLSAYPEQREFLFDKGCKFRILSILGNSIILEAII